MDPNEFVKIAEQKAAGMDPEQAGDGLLMGVEMFAGRVDAFLKEQGETTSLLISSFKNEKGKPDVRYDIMRIIPAENGKTESHEHVSQHSACEILGIPELFSFTIEDKVRKNIIESFTALSEESGVAVSDMVFHIKRGHGKYNLKLSLHRKNGLLIREIDPEKTIQMAIERSEFAKT